MTESLGVGARPRQDESQIQRKRFVSDVNRWDEKAGLRTGCGVRSQVIDVLDAQIKRRPAMKKVSAAAEQENLSTEATGLTPC
jgi:hypothetical protein